MIYKFLDFTLNTDIKELSHNGEVIKLTKQSYELLLLFVSNTNRIFSKDDIVDLVWKGRHVTENTIDQSISKLRRILNSVKSETYIQTAYGKGFRFIPVVEEIQSQDVSTKPKNSYSKILTAFIIFTFVLVALYFVINSGTSTPRESQKSLLIILPAANASENDQSLNQASSLLLKQLFDYENIADLKDYKNKPEHLDRKQYLRAQWQVSPKLKAVTVHVEKNDNFFEVELNIANNLQEQSLQSFSNQNLSLALAEASKWLAAEIKAESSIAQIESFFPKDSYVLELYIRGLESYGAGEFDKAENYLQLCLAEKPSFHLARLQLAKVKNAQGKQEKSLALLDTLSANNTSAQMDISIESLRGDIYDTQGKYQQARDLYLSVLAKYQDDTSVKLDDIRYNLSYSYSMLANYDAALGELLKLETSSKNSQDMELLAHVFQKKASIQQKLGLLQEAKTSANKSLELFSQLQDLLGEAKTYITLARISTHQSKYDDSVQYLEQSLIIYKSSGYKLGVGATINELIYILMVQGRFTKAWQLNKEMHDIAIDIEYNAMLQISKQYSIDISRSQKKWDRAKLYLQEHLQMAQASSNKRALLKNKLLALDLYLDQGKTENIKSLIDEVQQHINEAGEIRLQPRINRHLARYYFLTNHEDKAVTLLLATKELAKKTEDGEIIIQVNNLLAEYYLSSGDARKALAILEESSEFNPLPYPYLLIKSKASKSLGKLLVAQDLANECKNTSNQWWSLEDERYLLELQNN